MDISRIATQKQISMIAFIKDKCEVEFAGNTAKEVYDFIGEWYPKALQMARLDNIIGSMGVTAYRARKIYHGNDVHGEWEELQNNRDAIAHEKFKGDVVRRRNPVEALAEFGISVQNEAMTNAALH